MRNGAAVIGIIGIPDGNTIAELEKSLGKPVRKIEKRGKTILLIGKGLFKKRLVISHTK